MQEDESDYLFNQIGLPDYLKGKSGVVPLVLDLERIQAVPSKVMVTLPPQRDYAMPAKGPTQHPGYQLTVTIPFTGDAALWHARPLGIGPGLQPRGFVDVKNNQLVLTFEHTDNPANTSWHGKKQDEMLRCIGMFLNYQAEALARHK